MISLALPKTLYRSARDPLILLKDKVIQNPRDSLEIVVTALVVTFIGSYSYSNSDKILNIPNSFFNNVASPSISTVLSENVPGLIYSATAFLISRRL